MTELTNAEYEANYNTVRAARARIEQLSRLADKFDDGVNCLSSMVDSCMENTHDYLGAEPLETDTDEAVAWWTAVADSLESELDAAGINIEAEFAAIDEAVAAMVESLNAELANSDQDEYQIGCIVDTMHEWAHDHGVGYRWVMNRYNALRAE